MKFASNFTLLGICAGLVLAIAANAQEPISIIKRDGLFGSSISVKGLPETANAENGVNLSVKDDGKTFSLNFSSVGGRTAQAGPAQANLPAPPSAPVRAEITNDQGLAISALTELSPGSGVFVAARHVLQKLPRQWLARALQSVGANLDQLTPFVFSRDGMSLDVVFLVPARKIPELFAGGPGRYSFKNLRSFNLDIKETDAFVSYQLGAVSPSATGKQLSRGIVSRIVEPHAYLPLTSGNFTGPASSGSLVYVGGDEWKFAGVIECINPSFSEKTIPVKGAARMITARALWSSQVTALASIDQILVEDPISNAPDCIRNDRRGGGGERGGRGK